MIYELRTYTVHAGKVGELQAAFEQDGYPVIKDYATLVGWWFTEVGVLNQVVHLWAYEDAGVRQKARTAMNADPRLVPYRQKMLPLIVSQSNMLLNPASFSPLQ